MNSGDSTEKGLFWKLPVLKFNQIGKLGPAFGMGAGCGFGFGIGLVGGAAFGPGIPGMQLGFGFGAGCGIGLGFGYGLGKGIAYDDSRKYSNVGKIQSARGSGNNGDVGDEIGAIVSEMADNTRRLAEAAARELDKWRRF